MDVCKIKFCGLRTEADVETACACGAWAIGLVFANSPRRIDEATAKTLAAMAKGQATRIGLFTDQPPEEVRRVMEVCDLDLAQIHRTLTADEAAAYGTLPLLRVFHVRGAESLETLTPVRGTRFLLDTYVPDQPGGTGKAFDWSLARKAAAYGEVILAGGLTPENVGTAIATAHPWGVDVSGGIELEKGVKDHARMRAFAEAVRTAENEE